MKSVLKLTTAAAALAGSALLCTPAANAAYVGIGVGPVGFDVYSGGYCDRWGCPNDYWTYPIFYGPVYYDNAWYRGPVYYRTVGGERWYWLHGAWHRDQWRGPRPSWAREVHYGPPRGLDYYRAHGFRVRDEDWRAWRDRDERYRAGYRDYDRGGYYGNEDRDRYRDHDMDRDQYRGDDRDRYNDRDMDRGNGYDREYDRDRGTYEHSGYDRDRDQYGRGNENGPDNGRDHNGYQRSGYERSDYERSSGGASGTGHEMHGTMHHTHVTHHATHHHMTGTPSDRDSDHGYQHTRYNPDMNRGERDHMHGDMDRTRSDDQTRDHGNNPTPDQDRSENQNGYNHTSYERPGSYGHAKGPPPSKARSQKSGTQPNPDDENNGPSD